MKLWEARVWASCRREKVAHDLPCSPGAHPVATQVEPSESGGASPYRYKRPWLACTFGGTQMDNNKAV